MNTVRRTVALPRLGLALSLLSLSACAAPEGFAPPEEPSPEGFATSVQALVGGSSTSIAMRSVVSVGGFCTGTVVGPRHVLTARHCVPHLPTGGAAITSLAVSKVDLTDSTYRRGTVVGYAVSTHWNFEADAALIVTDRDLGLEPVRVLDEPMDDWVGRRVFAVGYGAGHPELGGSFGAWLNVLDVNQTNGFTYAERGSGGETICAGDSGGPDFAYLNGEWYVAGVHSGSPVNCALNAGNGYSVRADRIHNWLRGLVRSRATFRYGRVQGLRTGSVEASRAVAGPGREYFVVTTASGTTVRSYTGSGLINHWTAPTSLGLTLGRVDTALADVTGDGRADLLVADSNGLNVYPSTSTASTVGFNTSAPITRNDLWPGATNVFLGDYDNNGAVDVLVQTTVGLSYLLTYNPSTRMFNPELLLPQLGGIQESTLTVADFTGDGVPDALSQTSAGATLFRGGGPASAPFTAAGSVASLRRGAAHVTPWRTARGTTGAPAGLVVVTTGGTSLWEATPGMTSPFRALTSWARSDLRANDTGYVVGDYDGDRAEDLLIVTPSGSYLYRGTGNTASPLLANAWVSYANTHQLTDYTVADLNGDGRSDLFVTQPNASRGYLGRSLSPWFTTDVFYASDLPMQAHLHR